MHLFRLLLLQIAIEAVIIIRKFRLRMPYCGNQKIAFQANPYLSVLVAVLLVLVVVVKMMEFY